MQCASLGHESGVWDEHSLGKKEAGGEVRRYCQDLGPSQMEMGFAEWWVAVEPCALQCVGVYARVPLVTGPLCWTLCLPGAGREPRHCTASQKIQHSSLRGDAASRDASRTEICSLCSSVGLRTHTLFDTFVSWIYRTY